MVINWGWGWQDISCFVIWESPWVRYVVSFSNNKAQLWSNSPWRKILPTKGWIFPDHTESSNTLELTDQRWTNHTQANILRGKRKGDNVLSTAIFKWRLSEYYATLKCLHTMQFNSREENGKPFDSIMVNPYKNCMYNEKHRPKVN